LLLGIEVKVIARVFKSLKFLGGTMHLKPTAGGQISTLIFGFGGEPYAYPMKNYRRTAKFFATWSLSKRYCSGL
jgi:hypothetical protein